VDKLDAVQQPAAATVNVQQKFACVVFHVASARS
jgi:hypothetical protein